VESFIAAMHARARMVTAEALRLVGAQGVGRMLDVGGGPATFAIAFAQAEPGLHAEVLDLGPVLPIARGHIRDAGLDGRVTVREGDLRAGDLGQGYDLVLVSAICHMLDEAENQDLLRRCARALNPGGRVAIREFILDPDRAGPPRAALFALNMLVGTARGNTYTEAEYRSWLGQAGFREVARPEPEGDWIIGRL
jgi:SAM-dependent methyltransferase